MTDEHVCLLWVGTGTPGVLMCPQCGREEDCRMPVDDTLGPCGCIDYHMADCPTRDRHAYEPDYYGDDYSPDRYEDEE